MSGFFSGAKGGLSGGSGASPFGMTTPPFKAAQTTTMQKDEGAANTNETNGDGANTNETNGDGANPSTPTPSNPFSFSGSQSANPFGAFRAPSNPSTVLGEVMGEKKKVDWSDAHIQLSEETMKVVNGKCELNPTLVSKYSNLH